MGSRSIMNKADKSRLRIEERMKEITFSFHASLGNILTKIFLGLDRKNSLTFPDLPGIP